MSKTNENKSIWKGILQSALKGKISSQGNIVLLGEPDCGKKSLIEGFKKLTKQNEGTNPKMKNYYNNLQKMNREAESKR